MPESRGEPSLNEAVDVPINVANDAPLVLDGLDQLAGLDKDSLNAIDEAFDKLVEDLSDVDEDEFDRLVYKNTKIRPMHPKSGPPTANNALENLILSGSRNNRATVFTAIENETANAASVAGTTGRNELATIFEETSNEHELVLGTASPEPVADTNAIELIVASSDSRGAMLEATALSETVAVSNQLSVIGKALTRPLLPESIELPTPMKKFLMKPRTKTLRVNLHTCESASNEMSLETQNTGSSNVINAISYSVSVVYFFSLLVVASDVRPVNIEIENVLVHRQNELMEATEVNREVSSHLYDWLRSQSNIDFMPFLIYSDFCSCQLAKRAFNNIH